MLLLALSIPPDFQISHNKTSFSLCMTAYHLATTRIFIIDAVISQMLLDIIMNSGSILAFQRYEKNMVKKGKKIWILKRTFLNFCIKV